MRVELIHPPYPNSTDDRLDPPMGLLYIAAYLEQNSVQVGVADLSGQDEGHWNIRRADIYGITAYISSLEITKEIVTRCKELNPKCIIVVGGAHPTACPDDFPYADYVVIGPGEQAMLDIATGKATDRIILGRQLDNPFLFPAFHLVDIKSYHRKIDGKPSLPFLTSRGCPFHCAYCLPGDTKILTEDLHWISIKDVTVGMSVVGVLPHTNTRQYKYYSGKVLAVYKRRAMVYAIDTTAGTVKCTEEHPWLMKKKWASIKDIKDTAKYNASFSSTRAALRKLSTPQPDSIDSIEYMRGYIAGCFAGDGHIRQRGPSWEAGLVGDFEMLDKVLEVSKKLGLSLRNVKYNGGKLFYNCNRKVVTYIGKDVRTILSWVNTDTEDQEFIRGYLAGVYDAEGTYSKQGGALRICNFNLDLKTKICKFLDIFGFKTAIFPKYVMLYGGLSENIRFLSLCKPSVPSKKRGWVGKRVNNASKIMGVRELGVMDVYNIATETETYIADGFVTHNCGLSKMHELGNVVKLAPPWLVAEQIAKIKEDFGIDRINFQDDIFTLKPSRLYQLLSLIEPLNISFRCMGRAGYDTEETYKRLARAGCIEVAWGIESGSQYILDRMRKEVSVEDNYNVIQWAKKHGITSRAFFIIGFPGETKDTLEETKEFIINADPDQYFVSTFVPYPGTDVAANPGKYGITEITDDRSQFFQVSKDGTGGQTTDTKWLSRQEFRELELSFRNWLKYHRKRRGFLQDYERKMEGE